MNPEKETKLDPEILSTLRKLAQKHRPEYLVIFREIICQTTQVDRFAQNNRPRI